MKIFFFSKSDLKIMNYVWDKFKDTDQLKIAEFLKAVFTESLK